MSALQAFQNRLVAGVSATLFFTYLLSLGLSFYLIVATELGQELLAHDGNLLVGFFFLTARLPIRINLLASSIVILIVYASCFWFAIRSDGSYVSGFRNLAKGIRAVGKIPNWLTLMPFLSSSLLLGVVWLISLLDSLGLPTGSLFPPSSPPPAYVRFYGLAYAPILEEITFRITTLGLLVSARSLWASWAGPDSPTGRKSLVLALRGFLQPDTAKSIADLPSITKQGIAGIHWTEWILLFLTSILFGWAHLGLNSNWQSGKTITAGLSGVVLGIVFLAYGAYASILLHWFFDLYFEAFYEGSVLLGGVFTSFGDIVFFLANVVGILGVALVVFFVARRSFSNDL